MREWRRGGAALLVMLALAFLGRARADELVLEYVDEQAEAATDLAQDIWSLAELGYLEEQSSQRLQAFLGDRGFRIETEAADIPTAFIASAGSGEPVIGILAEFDALPGLSQAAVPHRQPLEKDGAGHACGHHLFGAASATAGAAVAAWLAETGRAGTVRVYGTPAEEGGSGKVYLTRAGRFDDVDVVLHWHPSDRNDASPSSSTSNKSGRFTFHGTAAHAAAAPERGRSALDGVEAMNFMVNLMREHVPQESRLHYIITDGGDAPNIVPEQAQVYYYVRHPEAKQVTQLFERVVKAAEAAAIGTGTRMEYEVMHGNFPLLSNDVLARLMNDNLKRLGGIEYGPEEQAFAQEIRKTLPGDLPPVESAAEVQPFIFRQNMGSTDVGDVSWMVPTVGFGTATWVPGTPAHSWQAAAASGMAIGIKGAVVAAKTLARTVQKLYLEPETIAAARAELAERRGEDFVYAAFVGDREPPLDSRAGGG